MTQPFPRRSLLALFGGALLPVLGGCKEVPSGTPQPPYGRALDVTQANTIVEFDVRVEADRKNPLSRYDVVLEVFEKTPLEKGPPEFDSKSRFFPFSPIRPQQNQALTADVLNFL